MNNRTHGQPRGMVKWPFWLGDVLLLATALLIAWSSPGPLTPLAMAWCILAVGWGGVLACSPYWAEYWVSSRKRSGADDKILLKLYQLEARMADLEHKRGMSPGASMDADKSSSAMSSPAGPQGANIPDSPPSAQPARAAPGTPLMRKALGNGAQKDPNPAISRIIRGSERSQ